MKSPEAPIFTVLPSTNIAKPWHGVQVQLLEDPPKNHYAKILCRVLNWPKDVFQAGSGQIYVRFHNLKPLGHLTNEDALTFLFEDSV